MIVRRDNMQNIEVSVIIVNYNAGDYLSRCILSILDQSLTSFEIIVIDNASIDTSINNIPPDPRIKCIKNPQNLGFAKAQNQGIRISHAPFVVPLNFDIILEKSFLEAMIIAISRSEDIGMVAPKMLQMSYLFEKSNRLDNAGLLLPANRVPLHRGKAEFDNGQYNDSLIVFGAMGAAALYRKKMLEDIAYRDQYFDERYFMWYEDIDLNWRAYLKGWDCVYAPQAVVYHVGDVHGHGKSNLGARISIRNRWRTILTNECIKYLFLHFPQLAKHEIATIRHIVKNHLFKEYFWAILSFFSLLPDSINKRHAVQSRAKNHCLPNFPKAITSQE